MGSAIISFHQAGNLSTDRKVAMPVKRLSGARTEIMTTSGASARSVLAAIGLVNANKEDGGFVTITAVGANLWVTAGVAGTVVSVKPAVGATNGVGMPIMAGMTESFAVKNGEKIAAIEWS